MQVIPKIIILLIISFVGCSCYSQTKMIEVEVSDTVEVNPDEYIYNITLNLDENPLVTKADRESILDEANLNIILSKYDDIELVKQSPHVLKAKIYEALIYSTTIQVTSIESINRLINDLGNYSNVSGAFIGLIVHENSPPQIRLKQKLLNKSRFQADQTAQLIGKRIGEILEIYESEFTDLTSADGNENSGWTAYPPLSGMAQVFGFSNVENDVKIFSQKIRVKYELK